MSVGWVGSWVMKMDPWTTLILISRPTSNRSSPFTIQTKSMPKLPIATASHSGFNVAPSWLLVLSRSHLSMCDL